MSEGPALGYGGGALWDAVTGSHELDREQLLILELACRQRDRSDSLAEAAAAGDVSALRQERESALAMTRLLVALRLADVSGKRPQFRGARGVQKPSGLKVSSLDRARQAKSG